MSLCRNLLQPPIFFLPAGRPLAPGANCRPGDMTPKKVVVLGCGIAALVLVAGVTAVVLFFVYVGQDVKGMAVAVNSPSDVRVGQTFNLEVAVTNERPRKALLPRLPLPT